MVSNLIVAVCAIIPLFFLMLIGVAVKKLKLLTELELAHVNRMVFKIFFFFMMFYNIYTTDIAETFRPHLMLFGALGVLASALIGGIIICLFVGWKLDRRLAESELTNGGKLHFRLLRAYIFLVRYVVPVAIVSIFLHELLGK